MEIRGWREIRNGEAGLACSLYIGGKKAQTKDELWTFALTTLLTLIWTTLAKKDSFGFGATQELQLAEKHGNGRSDRRSMDEA